MRLYDVLGVAKDAAPTRLKSYRQPPRRASDLKSGHRNAAQQFVDVAAAYDLLSDRGDVRSMIAS